MGSARLYGQRAVIWAARGYMGSARLYGQRRAQRKTETVIRALEAGESEGEGEGEHATG